MGNPAGDVGFWLAGPGPQTSQGILPDALAVEWSNGGHRACT